MRFGRGGDLGLIGARFLVDLEAVRREKSLITEKLGVLARIGGRMRAGFAVEGGLGLESD